MKVMIVDDNVVGRLALDDFLRLSGVVAEHVADAEEAIERLPLARPDVLILDHWLPGMDGLELLHLLREAEKTRGLPVVFLTAATDAVTAVIERDLPALQPCMLLRKPVEPHAILGAAERMAKGGG